MRISSSVALATLAYTCGGCGTGAPPETDASPPNSVSDAATGFRDGAASARGPMVAGDPEAPVRDASLDAALGADAGDVSIEAAEAGDSKAAAGDASLDALADGAATLDERKRAFLALRFGLWHHFGILTYTRSWAQPDLPIDDFNPGTTLDPQQWAAAAKSAGAQFGVLTTRHHDGFALWPSNASAFNVGHTTWYAQVGGQPAPDDKGDVVQQFVNGYRAEGLLPVFYYSIWDTTQGMGTGAPMPEQMTYIKTQLTELMSNYGPIPVLIFDGWSWNMGHYNVPYAKSTISSEDFSPTFSSWTTMESGAHGTRISSCSRSPRANSRRRATRGPRLRGKRSTGAAATTGSGPLTSATS
jgi:hypothetical protein